MRFSSIATILLCLCIDVAVAGGDTQFRISTLSIVTTAGGIISFQVEVAETEAQRRRGLMFRRELPAGHGMLLRYDQPRVVTIWMKNTFVALDILFIDEQERIAGIAADAQPESERLMISAMPVRAVLEIPAGQAKALGIRTGNQVILPRPEQGTDAGK